MTKRFVLAGVLLMVATGAASAEEVEAAAPEVVESGMSPVAVSVFTREDIEATGASTIPDLLRLVPGMDVVVATPFYASISSRLDWTEEGSRYLVLVDGLEVNLEYLGLVPWEILQLSLDDVERIEVFRGPLSSRHGAGALAGAISITTRARPVGSSAWFGLTGGELDAFEAGARASVTAGSARLSFFGGGSVMSSFKDPSTRGRRVGKVRTAADLHLTDSSRLFLELGYSEGSGDFLSDTTYTGGSLVLGTLRMGYESDSLLAQIAFRATPLDAKADPDLVDMTFSGVHLADLMIPENMGIDTYSFQGGVRWALPRFWEPVGVNLGAEVRMFWLDLNCTYCLNPETYADITSPRYHQPGVSFGESETRLGTFVGLDLSPVDWMTATGSVRLDSDTDTGEFVSARLAVAAHPLAGQSFRLGMGRSYRRSAYLEDGLQLSYMAQFPDESPITGAGREAFQEFCSRAWGQPRMTNDELLAFEIGYQGQFFDRRLSVGAELYYGRLSLKRQVVVSNIAVDPQGLPDLDISSFDYTTASRSVEVFGSEVSVRFDPSRFVSLHAWWAHRKVDDGRAEIVGAYDTNPTDLFAVGGRYRSSFGLLGSLYMFARSEFARRVEMRHSLFEPAAVKDVIMETEMLFLGRLGWRLAPWSGFELEAGVKAFLPVSPSSSPHFRYRESMGGANRYGQSRVGEDLGRVVLGYLQGTF